MNYCETRKPYVKPVHLDSCVDTVIATVNVADADGVIRKVVKPTLVDYSALNVGFKPSDFCLSNMIAAGAVGSLTELNYSSNDFETSSMRLNEIMDKIEN